MRFRLSDHAVQEMESRGIQRAWVETLLARPDQIAPASAGRRAYQSLLRLPDGRIQLLRAIVEDAVEPAVVVTVYRTGKIDKYWSKT